MRKPVIVCLVAGLTLSACGTRLNPFNWFGPARSVPVEAGSETNPLIPARRASVFRTEREEVYLGQPIAELSDLTIERRPGGAIVRASGIARVPGRYEAQLTPIEAESTGGRLVYALEVRLYRSSAGTGPKARRVTVATFLTDQELSEVAEIEVRSASNALATRR
ncbi:hypothetical protein [Roseivivax sp.]